MEISLRKGAIAMGGKSACGAFGRQMGLRSLMWSMSRIVRTDSLALKRPAFSRRQCHCTEHRNGWEESRRELPAEDLLMTPRSHPTASAS
jgi:hypothetical protein